MLMIINTFDREKALDNDFFSLGCTYFGSAVISRNYKTVYHGNTSNDASSKLAIYESTRFIHDA